MPPGTGDIQLTLVQRVTLAGAVLVSTPQEVALIDVRRGAAMFEKTATPILGVVENMAYFPDPSTGAPIPIFGRGGARGVAEELRRPSWARCRSTSACARLATPAARWWRAPRTAQRAGLHGDRGPTRRASRRRDRQARADDRVRGLGLQGRSSTRKVNGVLVPRPGGMVLPADLAPGRLVEGRERNVALDLGLDLGEVDAPALGRASSNRATPPMTQTSSAPSSAACSRAISSASEKVVADQRLVRARRSRRATARRSAARAAASWAGFPGLAAHDHRLAQGELLEQGHVGLQPPRQVPPRPITPLRARATGPSVKGWRGSDRHLGLDVRMSLVALEREVARSKANRSVLSAIVSRREGIGLAGQLLARLVHVVQVEVGVAEGVDELAGLLARRPWPPSASAARSWRC